MSHRPLFLRRLPPRHLPTFAGIADFLSVGRAVVHPAQHPVAVDGLRPTDAEVERPRQVAAAADAAEAAGGERVAPQGHDDRAAASEGQGSGE